MERDTRPLPIGPTHLIGSGRVSRYVESPTKNASIKHKKRRLIESIKRRVAFTEGFSCGRDRWFRSRSGCSRTEPSKARRQRIRRA